MVLLQCPSDVLKSDLGVNHEEKNMKDWYCQVIT